jgi:acyl-coenzyme A thioesterase PaaI-like protein
LTSEVLRGSSGAARRFEIDPHNCFACGELNEHGLQLRMHLADPGSWTEVSLPERFEGWQGIAHGGILATLADEVMAWSLFIDDQVGLTARLSLDFRRPAQVGHMLRAEGWITDRRRLRYDTAARITDVETGDLVAEATGVYVAAPPSRAREIRERYGLRVSSPAGTTT